MNLILLLSGFVLLIKSAELFVDGSSNLAKSFGIPPLIVGLTIVSLGTSAPEAAVSVTSAVKDMNEISIGNVLGSNICNLLLVLGICSLFQTIRPKKESLRRDFPIAIYSVFLLFVPTLFYFCMGKSGEISRVMGLILLVSLIAYFYILFNSIKKNKDEVERVKFSINFLAYIFVGIVGIVIGGDVVVNAATNLADDIGISQSVIALSVVAIGTSLPEMATTIVAAKKKENDIAIGNIIGSNILNIFFILGLSSFTNPIKIGNDCFFDILFVLLITIFVYLMLLRKRKIDGKRGLLLLTIYFSYMLYIIIR
jgi:cation:H+ antiporter